MSEELLAKIELIDHLLERDEHDSGYRAFVHIRKIWPQITAALRASPAATPGSNVIAVATNGSVSFLRSVASVEAYRKAGYTVHELSEFAALRAASPATAEPGEDWKDDPSADERWQAEVQAWNERAFPPGGNAVAMREAFKPFADFMAGNTFSKLPDHFEITHGSALARKQLTAGDLRKLAAALDAPQAQEGEPLDPPAIWLDGALRNLARELLADPKTYWIGERDPKQHICWTAADRLAALYPVSRPLQRGNGS